MAEQRKSLYLLADSQLLFWNAEDSRLISSIRESLNSNQAKVTKAAYIGASNGDKPEFFELFKAAMDGIDIHESRMIHSTFSLEDREFLEAADLILLAGGNFSTGWKIISETGMDKIISQKFYSGSVIVGISAGAIQLGMGGYKDTEKKDFIQTLQLFPYYIDVHDDDNNWAQLKETIKQKEQYSKGFSLSAGGGMIYHPDSVVEPLRKTVNEFHQSELSEGSISSNILLPPESAKTGTE